MAFQTEFEFELPKGYIDRDGNLHKRGTMRLATAVDEILPMKDPEYKETGASYNHTIIKGYYKAWELKAIDTKIIENLYFWFNLFTRLISKD